jgi:putative transposase
MADYRRADQPGGTYFFTLVTYKRQPIFTDAANVDRLRAAVLAVMNERPFEFRRAHYCVPFPCRRGFGTQ